MKVIKKIRYFLLQIFELSLKFPKRNLFAFFLLLGITLGVSTPVPVYISLDDLIDKNFESYESLHKFKKLYKDDGNIILLLEKKEKFTGDDICKLRVWTANQNVYNKDIENIFSFLDLRRAEEGNQKLLYPKVFQGTCDKDYQFENKKHPLSQILVVDENKLILFIDLVAKEKGKYGSFSPTVFRDLKENFESNIAKEIPGSQVSWTGPAVFQHYNFEGMQNIRKTNLLVLVTLILLLRLIFGTFKISFILVGSLLITAVSIFALMSFLGFPIDSLSNNLFLIIIITTIEDFIFVSHYRMKNPEEDWTEAFKRIILPSFFTSLTTVVGFFSLLSSDLEIIQRFGFIAGIGAIIEWYMIFSLVPSFLTLFKRLQVWTNSEKTIIRERAFQFIEAIKIPKGVTWCFLLVIPLSVFLVNKLNYKNNTDIFFPPDHPYSEDLNNFTKTNGIRSYVNLIFEDTVSEDFISETIQEVQKGEGYSFIESPLEIKKDFQKGISEEFYATTDYSLKSFLRRYYSEEGHTRFIIYYPTSDTVVYQNLKKKVDKLCEQKECWLSGIFLSYSEFNNKILNTMIKSLALCTILVLFILFGVARLVGHELRDTLKIIFTAMWGPFAIISLLYWNQTPIFFITSTSFAYLIGLTGDNALQYLLSSNQDLAENMEDFGSGSFRLALIMSLMSLLFLTTYFYPPRLLGSILALGFLLSFVGDYLFLKSLRS